MWCNRTVQRQSNKIDSYAWYKVFVSCKREENTHSMALYEQWFRDENG